MHWSCGACREHGSRSTELVVVVSMRLGLVIECCMSPVLVSLCENPIADPRSIQAVLEKSDHYVVL